MAGHWERPPLAHGLVGSGVNVSWIQNQAFPKPVLRPKNMGSQYFWRGHVHRWLAVYWFLAVLNTKPTCQNKDMLSCGWRGCLVGDQCKQTIGISQNSQVSLAHSVWYTQRKHQSSVFRIRIPYTTMNMPSVSRLEGNHLCCLCLPSQFKEPKLPSSGAIAKAGLFQCH